MSTKNGTNIRDRVDASRQDVAGDEFWISANVLAATLVCGILGLPTPVPSVTAATKKWTELLQQLPDLDAASGHPLRTTDACRPPQALREAVALLGTLVSHPELGRTLLIILSPAITAGLRRWLVKDLRHLVAEELRKLARKERMSP